MNRLIEKTVFSGFVTAWRLATWPTRISPSLVNATTEGVSRLPSWLGMTTGLPPSITATTELVVPRSMPITLPMAYPSPGPSRSAPSVARSCLIGMRRMPGRRSAFGNVTVSTPSFDARLRPVEVEPGGSGTVRTKLPYRRSTSR